MRFTTTSPIPDCEPTNNFTLNVSDAIYNNNAEQFIHLRKTEPSINLKSNGNGNLQKTAFSRRINVVTYIFYPSARKLSSVRGQNRTTIHVHLMPLKYSNSIGMNILAWILFLCSKFHDIDDARRLNSLHLTLFHYRTRYRIVGYAAYILKTASWNGY